jgi:hypothetical protein
LGRSLLRFKNKRGVAIERSAGFQQFDRVVGGAVMRQRLRRGRPGAFKEVGVHLVLKGDALSRATAPLPPFDGIGDRVPQHRDRSLTIAREDAEGDLRQANLRGQT